MSQPDHKKSAGRPSADGATDLTERVNVVLSEEHKRRLQAMATTGVSVWVRAAIDQQWKLRTNQ